MINQVTAEHFSVWQFLLDGYQECVRHNVDAREALEAAKHYTQNVAAWTGVTSRVIITDSGDDIVFEWLYGQGVVFPPIEVTPQRDYRK